MKLTAIMALSDDDVFGVDGPDGPTMPWRLPPDLKRFKALTSGHAVLMGRRTFDSIGRRPLPNRDNVVVSRQPFSTFHDRLPISTSWANDPEQGLAMARAYDRASPFVIGGAEIWTALWPKITHVELTRVHTTVGEGRRFAFDALQWRLVNVTPPESYEGLAYEFLSYERVTG